MYHTQCSFRSQEFNIVCATAGLLPSLGTASVRNPVIGLEL